MEQTNEIKKSNPLGIQPIPRLLMQYTILNIFTMLVISYVIKCISVIVLGKPLKKLTKNALPFLLVGCFTLTGCNNTRNDTPRKSDSISTTNELPILPTSALPVAVGANETSNSKSWDSTKVVPYNDDVGSVVPIPIGFQVSDKVGERTVAEGLVIIGPDSSEWVWVPVPDIMEMAEQHNGTNWRGILYDFESGGKSTPKPYSKNGVQEPSAIRSEDNKRNNLRMAGSSTQSAEEFQNELQNKYNIMVASVFRYAGFYIGRFETGNLKVIGKAVVQRGNTDLVNIDRNVNWYTMYKKGNEIYADQDSVTTSLIWGSQWDATLRWMNLFEATRDYAVNSRTRGQYAGNAIPSGSNENYKIKNIYDMAGNVYDWTMLAGGNNQRLHRGGGYLHNIPASGYYACPPICPYPACGCRLQMFIAQ